MKLVAIAALCLASSHALAQSGTYVDRAAVIRIDVSNFAAVLPPQVPKEIADAIKNAETIKDVIPISGTESFNQQIVKAEEIVFDKSSHMILKNIQAPWLAVATRKLRFRDPISYSYIERDLSVASAPDGRTGAPGTRGADDYGETNRRGNDGHAGGAGATGSTGETLELPTIYVIAERLFDDKNNEIPPGILNLGVLVRGIDGGVGGQGGRGGDGGNAGNGKEGASSGFDCKEGPGPGGNGGPAGMGGLGGQGGNGGAGGTLVFVSLKQGSETFSYARVNNQGGRGSIGGRGGSPGTPGKGGRGAPRNGWCGPSGPGSPGVYPSPVNYGDGKDGHDGAKGEMFIVTVTNMDDFFKK